MVSIILTLQHMKNKRINIILGFLIFLFSGRWMKYVSYSFNIKCNISIIIAEPCLYIFLSFITLYLSAFFFFLFYMYFLKFVSLVEIKFFSSRAGFLFFFWREKSFAWGEWFCEKIWVCFEEYFLGFLFSSSCRLKQWTLRLSLMIYFFPLRYKFSRHSIIPF